MEYTPDQRAAIESRARRVVVSAAAGSGKTAVLTRRITERILSGEGDISRMTVVTFTRAAAQELIRRIYLSVSEELAKNPGNRRLSRQLLLIPTAKICTVHRYCLDLIRSDFPRLGLPSDIRPADNAQLKLLSLDVADGLITDCFGGEAGEELSSGFSDLADSLGGGGSDGRMEEATLRLYGTLSGTVEFTDTLEGCARLYDGINQDNYMDSVWGVELRDALFGFASHFGKLCGDAVAYLRSDSAYAPYEEAFSYDAEFLSSLDKAVSAGRTYAELRGLIGSFEPLSLRPLKKDFKTRETESFVLQRNEFKKELKKFKEKYFGCPPESIEAFAADAAKRVRKLHAYMKEFDRRLTEEKLRRHIISFSDMERLALRLLWDREKHAPTPTAKRISEETLELYVDEYQDTNEVQNLIFSLISGGKGFFVGDMKQSIYAFRGAAPTIFRGMMDGGEGDATVYLSENFRSSSAVISFCNTVFGALLNTAASGGYGEKERLKRSLPEENTPPRVELVAVEKGKGENEPAFVARRISELIKNDGLKPSDIAILTRSRKNVAGQYAAALSAEGIPCDNTSGSDLFETPEVLLAVSLLNVIDDPLRDLYLAAALKSPIYGVTLDELIFIRRSKETGSLYDALREFTAETGFSKGRRFLSELESFREASKVMPCDRLIWRLYSETRIMSLVCGDGCPESEARDRRNSLIQLYDYARGFCGGRNEGLFAFITFINDIIDGREEVERKKNGQARDAVTVTTIHKSKGLEYNTVFLCDTAHKFNISDFSSDVIFDPDIGVAFRQPRSPMREAAMIPVRRKQTEEELRVLYVALTRAKNRLIITAGADESPEFSQRPVCVSGYSLSLMSSYYDMLRCAVPYGEHGEYSFSYIDSSAVSPAEGADGYTGEDKDENEADDMTLTEAKRLVKERLSFRYPYTVLTRVPSKLSVSKLRPGALSEEEDVASLDGGEPDISSYVPKFIMGAAGEEAGGAERGTATHTFMQFCDYASVIENGAEHEARRLAEKKFIFESDIEKLDFRKIGGFFKSGLCKRIMGSPSVYREKRFIINYPAELFAGDGLLSEALKGEELLVQGIIDCVFEEDGHTVLVDYKTDSFPAGTPESEIAGVLRKRHTRQLEYYAYACGKLFSKPLSHIYIYSFALGREVEIHINGKAVDLK